MDPILQKAKKIRLLILDVDGVLTTGAIGYCSNGVEFKEFHVHDGLGIKLLQKAGIKVAVISAKKSEAVSKRLTDLQVEFIYLGHEDKLPIYEALKEELQLKDDAIAYLGDDLPDLPILRRVGLPMTVSRAPAIIQQHAAYITKKKPGKGAVREVCEFILESQDLYQSVVQSYLNK